MKMRCKTDAKNEYLNMHSYIYRNIGVVRELVATFITSIYFTYDSSKFYMALHVYRRGTLGWCEECRLILSAISSN